MTFLWDIHLYPPKHNCGAEYMAHNINKFLLSKGHHVRVLLNQANQYKIKNNYEFEGVQVFTPDVNHEDLARTCNVIITHLDYTKEAIHLGKKTGKKVVHFVHSHIAYNSVLDNPDVFVVYNSEWAKEKLNYPNKSFVLTPPCDWRQYDVKQDTEKSEYITLINLDWNKGGEVLTQIALRFPEKKFIGVEGSYSYDGRGQFLNQPKNVTVLKNTPDIMPIYRKTRLLIMPSVYESWGRTATEAMCSGIPVISSGTPGLRENCGEAGIYIEDRNDVEAWVREIKRLDDKKEYKKASDKAKLRSRELDPVNKLNEFERWLTSL